MITKLFSFLFNLGNYNPDRKRPVDLRPLPKTRTESFKRELSDIRRF